jgi:hypothetical protein
MAKVVKKQPLRVAGKVTATTVEPVAKKKIVRKPIDQAEEVEVVEAVELTAEEQQELEKEVEAKKSKAKAKKEKAEAKLQTESDAIKNCGYVVGDVARTKNGSEKEITKITSRAQGVHLWWETLGGISAGGNYTSRILGKVVDGNLIDPITNLAIEVAEKPKAKKKAEKVEPVSQEEE